MENKSSNIKERVLQIAVNKGLSKEKFFESIGMSYGNFKGKSKETPLNSNAIADISTLYPDISLDWLINGNEPMIKSETKIITPGAPLSNQDVPLYDLRATASVTAIFSGGAKTLETIHIPNLPKCDGAIYITGDSMFPLLKSGDIVLFKEGHDPDFILWGEMYLVYLERDGEEYFAVKYLQRASKDGYIRLVSYNEHHQPVEFPIDCLKKWALVKASIRINSAV